MGKGSGACGRPGISLGTSDSASPDLNLGGDAASISEINTTLELKRPAWGRWRTKDERVSFQKTKEGWEVDTISDPVHKAFEEYGITSTSSYEHIYFPSLKTAQQAVGDVSLEAGLNIDSRLTKGKSISYKIGDLPLRITREEGHWRIRAVSVAIPPSLKNHFNNVEEFNDTWYATDSAFAHHPTRKAAHQAVLTWLAQTITEGK